MDGLILIEIFILGVIFGLGITCIVVAVAYKLLIEALEDE